MCLSVFLTSPSSKLCSLFTDLHWAMEFHSLPKLYLIFSLSILFLSPFQAQAATKISYCGTSSLSLSVLTFYSYHFGLIRSVKDRIRNSVLLLCVLMFDYFCLLILTFHLYNGVFLFPFPQSNWSCKFQSLCENINLFFGFWFGFCLKSEPVILDEEKLQEHAIIRLKFIENNKIMKVVGSLPLSPPVCVFKRLISDKNCFLNFCSIQAYELALTILAQLIL